MIQFSDYTRVYLKNIRHIFYTLNECQIRGKEKHIKRKKRENVKGEVLL